MCIRWHLKETALQGTITWSEMGKLNIQYWLKKVYWVHCTKRKAIRSGCWNCILYSNMQDILNKDPTPFKQSLSWVCQNWASERKDLHFIYLVDKVHFASWSPTFQTKGTSKSVHNCPWSTCNLCLVWKYDSRDGWKGACKLGAGVERKITHVPLSTSGIRGPPWGKCLFWGPWKVNFILFEIFKLYLFTFTINKLQIQYTILLNNNIMILQRSIQ